MHDCHIKHTGITRVQNSTQNEYLAQQRHNERWYHAHVMNIDHYEWLLKLEAQHLHPIAQICRTGTRNRNKKNCTQDIP